MLKFSCYLFYHLLLVCILIVGFSWKLDDYRLTVVEELTRATMKKLTQGMAEHNKAMASAKTDEEKNTVVSSFMEVSL